MNAATVQTPIEICALCSTTEVKYEHKIQSKNKTKMQRDRQILIKMVLFYFNESIDLWLRFQNLTNEMIVTKNGR